MLALRVLGASLLLACTGVAAGAADLNSPPAPARSVPMWSGLYLGVHAGYAAARASGVGFDGILGGGQVGFNAQIANNFVVGLEGDFAASDIGRTDSTAVFGIAVTATTHTSAFGTVRGRAGVTFDRFMIYGTGGFAWAVNRLTGTIGGVGVSDMQTHIGYTLGAGIEWMVSPAWTARAEYLYANLGSQGYFLGAVQSGPVSANVVRFSVNYLFR